MIEFLLKRNYDAQKVMTVIKNFFMMYKKTTSSNQSQIEKYKKTDKNWKKNYQNHRIKLSNFIKQNYIEVERGVAQMNYLREVAILINF